MPESNSDASARAGLVWHRGHVDEDVLTRLVFSTLRYVPTARQAFLSRLANLNNRPTASFEDDAEVVFEPWPGWYVPDAHQSTFAQIRNAPWNQTGLLAARRTKGSLVPDVVMSSPSWRFVVEAEASKPYDAAQLVQQYALDRLGEHRQLRTFYILVGPTLGPPLRLKTDIRRIWRQHERKLSSGNADLDHFLTHLLWIGWGDIEGIFRRAAAEVDLNEALILLDAAEFLGAQGYRDVEPPWHAVQASQRRMALLSALVEALHRADSLDVEILERVVAARDALERLGQLQRPHLDGTQGLR